MRTERGGHDHEVRPGRVGTDVESEAGSADAPGQQYAEAGVTTSGADSQVVVILAMMNIAEAYLAAKSQCEEDRRRCRERVSGLLGRLDRQAD